MGVARRGFGSFATESSSAKMHRCPRALAPPRDRSSLQRAAEQAGVDPLQKSLWPCQPHSRKAGLHLRRGTMGAKSPQQEACKSNWRRRCQTHQRRHQTLLGLREIGSERERLDKSCGASRAERALNAFGRIVPAVHRNLEARLDLAGVFCLTQEIVLKSRIR